MRLNLRVIIIAALIILAIGITISYTMYRITEDEVIVYKMLKFNEVEPNSERVLRSKAVVKEFTYAVRFTDKQPGIVDIVDPPYKFVLGDKEYYLWVSESYGQGTLMKLPNTETIYTISASRAKKLLDILKQEYESF